jgi:hypothetical protein
MSLVIDRSGVALWRGKQIGKIQRTELGWFFTPGPQSPVPGMCQSKHNALRDNLTRELVQVERSERRNRK